jgi:hypothetical protein
MIRQVTVIAAADDRMMPSKGRMLRRRIIQSLEPNVVDVRP